MAFDARTAGALACLAVLLAGCILPNSGGTPTPSPAAFPTLEPTATPASEPTATQTPQPTATPSPAFTIPGQGACARDADCMATGCSGQVCANASTVTTCEFRPEYACYSQHARCGCMEGACAWSDADSQFESCLNQSGGTK